MDEGGNRKMKHILLMLFISIFIISCNQEKGNNKETEKIQIAVESSNQMQATDISENTGKSENANQMDTIKEKAKDLKSKEKKPEVNATQEKPKYPIITFIELGSVNCVPCKKMQPIMKSLEEKYGEQLKVIFYDVWKAEYKPKAAEYGIRLIPTQVFLDHSGKEVHRHEGFYPEEEIDKFLQSKGLKVVQK